MSLCCVIVLQMVTIVLLMCFFSLPNEGYVYHSLVEHDECCNVFAKGVVVLFWVTWSEVGSCQVCGPTTSGLYGFTVSMFD